MTLGKKKVGGARILVRSELLVYLELFSTLNYSEKIYNIFMDKNIAFTQI